MSHDWQRERYLISTDRSRFDLETIHELLKTSYWAADRPLALILRSIEHSLAFGMYDGTQQIGFARVITDYATFAYLADVIIAERYQGQGLGKWLIQTITSHPELRDIRRWLLITRDAQGLYRQFGFTSLESADRYMVRIVERSPQPSQPRPPSSTA
ncbi:MAG TPA: GNAT family N-acetyltransferase [Herpetosiphonaceae bacterium]